MVLLSACGSDSSAGPKTPTAAQDAGHYDSLATALFLGGSHADSIRARAAEVIAGVAADGQAPNQVAIVLDAGGTNWYATFANLVDSAQTDSTQVFLFWSDVNVGAVVDVRFRLADFHLEQAIVEGGDANPDSTASVSATFNAASGACTFTSITNVDPTFPDYDPSGSACLGESGAIGIIASTFPNDSTATNALRSFAMPLQTVPGVRLQFLSAAAYQSVASPPPKHRA